MKRQKLTKSTETAIKLSYKLSFEVKLKKDFSLSHMAIFLKDVLKNNKDVLKKNAISCKQC